MLAAKGYSTAISAVACSWFTNDCSRPIDISFVSAKCRFLPSLVYPNPAENMVKIETTEAILGIKVTNAFGQLVA